MKEKIYKILPHFLQNLMITLYNLKSNYHRYGGKYDFYRKKIKASNSWSLDELKKDQKLRFKQLVDYSIKNSSFYRDQYKEISNPSNIEEIERLPIISKEVIRQNLDIIYTIKSSDALISKTGGTTGKSLEVLFTKDNFQERFAFLDNFRSISGYELGKKTAWFSGKNLVTNSDITKRRFWKTDFYYNVRYYSTFHLKNDYIKHYINNLIDYKPEFLVGFPSNMYEIAKYGRENDINFPEGIIKAIFPTAETITLEGRSVIESFFKTKLYNQYASSEGAPFIFECIEGNLHLELQSGVFEVLDQNNKPSRSGRLILTSFTTYGTPLIRYDIGDNLTLSDRICSCKNNNPLVEEILGRTDDFVFSIENGKINLGNISNTLKGVKGIIKFQVIQDLLDELQIMCVVDNEKFNPDSEAVFLENWRDRVGKTMKIKIIYVEDIKNEKSGKYRMVKNSIKDIIENLTNESNIEKT